MKIKARYRSKVLALFDQIPGLLSRYEKRVVFNKIVENSYAEQYEETFFWLSNSMIFNECFLCNDPNVGLSVNENRTYIKCYLCDTELLFSHAFDENELVEEEIYKPHWRKLYNSSKKSYRKNGVLCIPPYMAMCL